MFDKNDVYPFVRVEENPVYSERMYKRRSGWALSSLLRWVMGTVSPGLILAGIVGFLLGRAIFWGELTPFAPAFAAATAVIFGRRGILVVASIGIGVASVMQGVLLAADIAQVIFSFLVTQAVPPSYIGRRWVMPALVFGLILSVKSAFLAFAGSTPYDYINVLFESLLAAALVPACIASFRSIQKLEGVKPLGGEETIGLLVVMAGIIAGTGDLQLSYFSANGFLSRLIILLAALVGGAGLGAAAGAVVGVIPGLAYAVTPSLVGAYSFSGVLAGLGGIMGKVGICLSFLASNIILAMYFDNLSGMESVIAETTLACLVFLAVPERLVRKISISMVQDTVAAPLDDGREQLVSSFRGKLREYSSIFRELARVFGENTALAEKKDDEQGIKQLLSEISKKVCDGCGLFSQCWEKDYYRTYQCMLDMFTLSEVYGRVKVSDIPEELKIRCTRARELTITATCLYEAFKVGRYWQNKFLNGQGIVGDQLKGVSTVIDALAEDFQFDRYAGEDSDTALKQKLRQLGLPVKEIKALQVDGRREISVSMRACQGDLDCRYKLAPVVSELMGQLFSATGCVCEGFVKEGICKFRLYQGPQYRVEVGAAGTAKDGSAVSGDVYDFIQLKEGKFAAILSDGMGIGESAARVSSSLIQVTKRMLEAGLEMESAIKSINSVLALKSTGESFATMDMVVINLYSGQGEFVKIAAPPTFLIRGGKVRSIRASSLPVGILNDIDVSITEKKLASRDVIVMLTDGVLDAHSGGEDKEDWITSVLQELDGLEPKEMAELLLKLAQTGNGDELKAADDMAVVVIRLEKERVVELPR